MLPNKSPEATVYVCVTPKLVPDNVEFTTRSYDQETFRKFIDDNLLKEPKENGFFADSWMFCYELRDGREVNMTENQMTPIWYNSLRRMAENQRITPSHIVSLRDAFFCKQQGIDPLSPEGQHQLLIQAPGYKASGTNFGFFNNEGEQFPTFRAVDTGHGVLLYCTEMSVGREAYNSLLQHCADNFYNPNLCIDRLRFFDVCIDLNQKMLVEHPQSLNFNFNHHSKNFSFKDLFQRPLLDKKVLKEGLQVKEYDMLPLAENYSLFLDGEDVRYQAYTKTFDISILDEIVRNGYPTERLSPEWYFICSYTRQFRDLADQIVLCEDPKQMAILQHEAKGRAEIFLDRDFPQRRQLTEEQRQSIFLKQTPYVEIPSEGFNRAHKL